MAASSVWQSYVILIKVWRRTTHNKQQTWSCHLIFWITLSRDQTRWDGFTFYSHSQPQLSMSTHIHHLYYRWQLASHYNTRAHFQLISQYHPKLLPSRAGSRTRIKFDVGSGNVGFQDLARRWGGDSGDNRNISTTFPLFHSVSFPPPVILLSKTLMIVSTLLTSNGGSTSCAKLRFHIFNFLSSTINYTMFKRILFNFLKKLSWQVCVEHVE